MTITAYPADTTSTGPMLDTMPGTAIIAYDVPLTTRWWASHAAYLPSMLSHRSFDCQVSLGSSQPVIIECKLRKAPRDSVGTLFFAAHELELHCETPSQTYVVPDDSAAVVRPELEILEELAGLSEDWDSYGAAPIHQRAIRSASDLMVTVAKEFGTILGERARPYAVAPVADGGVFVEWRGPDTKLQVRARPDGDFRYLMVRKVQHQRIAQEQSRVSLAEVLRQLVSVLRPKLPHRV